MRAQGDKLPARIRSPRIVWVITPPPVLLCARPGADNDSTTTPGRRASTAKPASGKRRRSSTGKGRKPAAQRVPKPIFHVLGRLCEIFGLLAQLFEIQKMPDPVVLQGTSMAIATFFEDAALAELQHPALALIRAVFSCYPTHRMVMVDDILVLLGKLPTEKRNLRNYRLQGGGMVQMVSAMFLVLVQNCIVVPERSVDEGGEDAALQKVNPRPTRAPLACAGAGTAGAPCRQFSVTWAAVR